MLKHAILPALLLTASAATAQDAGWTYKATLYGWLPGLSSSIDTKFGPIETDANPTDVLENLDMAFMGTFAAQNGRLGFVGDILYADLSNSKETPRGLFGEARADMKLAAISAYALYRVTTSPDVQLDLGAGFRNFDLDLTGTLTGGLLPKVTRNPTANWTDPLIAARLNVPINDRWFLAGFADWGGTGSGDETYQVYGGVGYNFDANWSSQLGYRYMDISKEIDKGDVNLGLSGGVISVSYSF